MRRLKRLIFQNTTLTDVIQAPTVESPLQRQKIMAETLDVPQLPISVQTRFRACRVWVPSGFHISQRQLKDA